MGTALLSGILASTPIDESHVRKFIACVKRQESAKKLESRFADYNATVEVVCDDNVRAVTAADVVILGFQPGDVGAILGEQEMADALEGKTIVSMLAGVGCQMIKATLMGGSIPHDEPAKDIYSIVRVLPSIGAQINESMSFISESKLSEEAASLVKWLFGRVGATEVVAEELIDTVVGISATCHALAVTAVDAVVDGSVSRGISRAASLKIAAQCLRSASTLLLDKMTLEELKDSMSVPRGITTEAWIHLDRGNIRPAISSTVREAVDYANRMA